MCAPSRLQQHIRNLTNDGEVVARFLVETVECKTPGAKAHHQMEAVKLLNRYGLSDGPENGESQFWGLIPTPEELAASPSSHSRENGNPEGQGEETDNSELNTHNYHVTHLDILNYEIAHLIRTETAEGHTIAEFLSHVMTRRDQSFTPKKLRIKQTDRMAAAKEILRRGHGHFGRKPKLTVYADDTDEANDYDTLHTDLAKRMREYNEHGTAATRFLLDVMSDTSLDPEEAYTWHHKMSAAQELIRRGWDTNYDNITPEMLQAYWQDQQSPRLSIGQKKHLAGLPTFTDEYDQYDSTDYEAISQQLRDQEEREAIAEYRHSREGGDAAVQEAAGHKPPLPAGEGPGEIETPFAKNESNSKIGRTDRHPRENGNSTGQGTGNDGNEANFNEEADPDIDCYFEPLTPEEEAIFNYNSLMESGEFEEGEISIVPPSEAARRNYAIALKQTREAAARDGVPLLPNPLAGKLKSPLIRSP